MVTAGDSLFLDLSDGLDLDSFWQVNESCKCFTRLKARCALTFSPDDHWLFEFLPVASTIRYYHDKSYRDELHREANRITRQGIGLSFFEEDTWQTAPKRIENLFGCEFHYTEGATPWLVPVTGDPVEFQRVLDRAEKTVLSAWAFPEPFLKEWESRKGKGCPLPALGTGSRGPSTIMTSVLAPETVFYWFYDHPGLMKRFRDILTQKMVELNRLLRAFSGYTQNGWWITDDNCALFNRSLYREYCLPVLQTVLDTFAPQGSNRYQHSDSAMGHLLAEQNELGINSCNYGPTVDAGLIREKMPGALIQGQLPPLLLRNGDPQSILQRVRDDFRKAGGSGGLIITTAGSLAAGTGIGRMRYLMKIVQDECRYP